ncbi:MAG: bifunctional glutamate N-acetyltransferase/amino-acid acetyltransferase ArgJ [Nanoarchaeota archaeon]|nr:bifunctional glutamate N-acetyltransferase/amino-acid acetyltransferase ArgJ [Nanoarchaeota archaeon]
MKLIPGNITEIKGITAVGKHVGIKKSKLDFAAILSDKICDVAAVYTKNNVKGAPLIVTKAHLKNGKARAIIINSGVANVCTGKKGIEDAKKTTVLAAKELRIKEEDVLVASTGVIGAYLPMDKIEKGIKGLKSELSEKNKDNTKNKENNVAEAILTTDIVKKEICIEEGSFKIAGIAKGSGMIHPNMATMLAFICTDAKISSSKLQGMLKKSVEKSFNMMTVDMDTSTSDMCIVMANGYAGKVDEKKFQNALDFVCAELAKKVARDGEGATKLIEVNVINAKDEKTAKILAKSVVSSNLVKCAFYGNDPNWGRILCAMGNSGAEFEETKTDVYFGKNQIVKNGVTTNFDYPEIKEIMDKKEVTVTIDIKQGKANASAFGCDMTEKYIEINAHYHS